jgi:hypothetical protein
VQTAGLTDSASPDLAEHVRSVMAARVDGYWMERGWRPPADESGDADRSARAREASLDEEAR